MRTRPWVSGAIGALLASGLVACTEDGPTRARDEVVPGMQDLDLVLPEVKRGTPRVRQTVLNSFTPARMTIDPGDGGTAPPEAVIPKLTSYYGTVSFDGGTLRWAYGAAGAGTGWSGKPEGTVHKPDGSVLMSGLGAGYSVDWLVYQAFKFDLVEEAFVPACVGLFANFSFLFEARVNAPFLKWMGSLREQGSTTGSAAQPRCPPSAGGGVTTTPEKGGLKICYWEVWVDLDGNVVDVIFLGCYPLQA